jgi:hypothetical protein
VNYREIPLTQGQVAIIDEDDYELVSQFTWHALWAKSTQSFYAVRGVHIRGGNSATIGMHNLIMGDRVDHKNGNTLDNRRENLRLATHSQNGANRRVGRNNSSGYKGVSRDKRGGRWQAGIKSQGKSRFLGYFNDPVDAAKAYDSAARELFGEFARTNFPLPEQPEHEGGPQDTP